MFGLSTALLTLPCAHMTFESRNGKFASYYAPGWFRAVDHFSWVAPFFDVAETPAPQVTEGATETVEDSWANPLALDGPFGTTSPLDIVAWKPVSLVAPTVPPAADVSLCADTSSDSDDFDDSCDVPATPAADLSLACYSATSIFIDGEVIPVATTEDRQLAFKQRVLARAGLPSPSPASRSGSSGTGPLATGSPDIGSPSKALSASARSFTPSAETIVYASYMSRNPNDARGTAKLFQMRARAQACVG